MRDRVLCRNCNFTFQLIKKKKILIIFCINEFKENTEIFLWNLELGPILTAKTISTNEAI